MSGYCSHCKQDKPMGDFPPSKATNTGQWCRVCLRESKRLAIGAVERDVVCGSCGGPFRSAFRKAAFCSRSCKDAAHDAAKKLKREQSKPARSCVHCGTDMPQTMRADAKFCSESCNSAAHALKRGNGRLSRGSGRRREIMRAEIIARDGAVCHICEQPVPEALISIDHIVPLADGGSHDASNLAVACLPCNCRKGARSVEYARTRLKEVA